MRLLTTQQAADYLGRSRPLILRWIREGRLPAQSVGGGEEHTGSWLIRKSDLDKMKLKDRKPGWKKGRKRGPKKK